LKFLSLKIAKKETARVKVNAHVMIWRGLLLVDAVKVFGDTSET